MAYGLATAQEFIGGLGRLAPRHRGAVVTVGTFDGLHLGHAALLQALKMQGRERGVPALAVIFEPQPAEYFAGPKAPHRLTRLRAKVRALFAAGADKVLCIRFDAALRQLTGPQFIEQVLADRLGAVHVQVGDDFRFGADRTGNLELLEALGPSHGYTVSAAPTFFCENGERVSSTRIRSHLMAGEIDAAAALLGRPYTLEGRVVGGDRLGRGLGFPTANLNLGRQDPPLRGVFAVRAGPAEGVLPYRGAANIGWRPTLATGRALRCEVHLLDYSGDLYGQCLKIEFAARIRGEQAFASPDALAAQIADDVAAVRQRLG